MGRLIRIIKGLRRHNPRNPERNCLIREHLKTTENYRQGKAHHNTSRFGHSTSLPIWLAIQMSTFIQVTESYFLPNLQKGLFAFLSKLTDGIWFAHILSVSIPFQYVLGNSHLLLCGYEPVYLNFITPAQKRMHTTTWPNNARRRKNLSNAAAFVTTLDAFVCSYPMGARSGDNQTSSIFCTSAHIAD